MTPKAPLTGRAKELYYGLGLGNPLERGDEPCTGQQQHHCHTTRPSSPATKVQSSVAGASLRETAERIIEGIPISYRDGDESEGRERTVNWLMDLLREFAAQRLATFINAAARKSEHDNIEAAIKDWVEADTKRLQDLQTKKGNCCQRAIEEYKMCCEVNLQRGEADTNHDWSLRICQKCGESWHEYVHRCAAMKEGK